MFGCHNCQSRPVPGTPYEQSACAHCRTRFDPHAGPIGHDTRDAIPDPEGFAEEILSADVSGSRQPPDYEEIFSALSRTLQILIRMKTRAPETFRVVEAKIDDPCASYSRLAEKLCCRKQNIFYHLKKAFELCPELEYALALDRSRTRWRSRQKACRPIISGT